MKRHRASLVLLIALIVSAIGAFGARVNAAQPVPAQGIRASGVSLLAWLPAEPILATASHEDDPRYPALVMDQDTGISHLAWEEAGIVRYAQRIDDSWLVDDSSWRGDSAVLALGPDGEPHLVYVDVSSIDTQLQVFHVHRSGDTWSLPQNVSGTMGPSTAPDVSVAVTDDIHILWSERLDRANRIYHAFSRDGGLTWSQVAPIPDAHGFSPALAAGAGNIIWAAWQGAYDEFDVSNIWVARWDGQAWNTPENITESVSGTSRLPDLLVASDGSLRIAWEQELLAGVPVVMYREGQPSSWSSPTMLSQGKGSRPKLALTSQGLVAAAWDAGDRVATKLQDAAGQFGDMQTIGEDSSGIRDVSLSASATGVVDVAWCTVGGDESTGALWFATQLREVAATPSPSHTPTSTATPTMSPTPSPTKAATMTRTPTPTIEPDTRTPTSIGTLPAPTSSATPTVDSTMAAPTLSPTPTSYASQPTIPVPTRYLPYSTFFPAIEKPSDLPQGPLILSEPRKPLRPERVPDMPQESPATQAAHDPWRWYGVSNVSSSGVPSRDVSMVLLDGGKALAVWAEEYPAFSLLAYSVLDDGVWNTAMPFYVGESPDLTVDETGTAHLVFSNEQGGAYDIFYATWSAGQWTPSQNISHTSGNSSQPAIAIADSGMPMVVWSDTTQDSHRIYHGWLENGLWSTYIIHGSIGGSAPDIVASKDARVWVSWQALEPWGTYEVYAAWGDGMTWQNFAILVSGEEMVDSIAPRMEASRLRGAYIVWQEADQATSAVDFADNTPDNYWWKSPSRLSTDRGDASQPDIAVHASGQVYVAWQETNKVAMTSRYPSATEWLSSTMITDSGCPLSSPHVSVDDSSRLLALWTASPAGSSADIHGQGGLFQSPFAVWLPSAYTTDTTLAQNISVR